MIGALAGCSAFADKSGAVKADIASCEDLLNQVWDTFEEDEKFAAYGGDFAHLADGKAGAFDMSDEEALVYTLLIVSMTHKGFCVVAALSRYINGLPYIWLSSIGNSLRISSISSMAVSVICKDCNPCNGSIHHGIFFQQVYADVRAMPRV